MGTKYKVYTKDKADELLKEKANVTSTSDKLTFAFNKTDFKLNALDESGNSKGLFFAEKLYKIGDVYETLSTTETTTTLGERFGGTWEVLPDRLEWNEKEKEYSNVGKARFRLNSNGRVDVVFDNYQQTGETVIDDEFKTKDYRILIATQQPSAGVTYYCIILPEAKLNNQGNRAYGSGSYLTGKAADRTFKRFKKTGD